MRPKVITHESEPNIGFLVDMDSASSLPLISGNGVESHFVLERESGKIVDALNGKTRIHFETSIHIRDLRAGQFAPFFSISDLCYDKQPLFPAEDATKGLVALWLVGAALPLPTLYVPLRSFRESDPMSRGIPAEAAEALLHLAAAKNNVTTSRALGKWKYGRSPAIEGTNFAWDSDKFLTAWMWGKWRQEEIRNGIKMSRSTQWGVMKALGYEKSLSSFRSMISRLGLVVAD